MISLLGQQISTARGRIGDPSIGVSRYSGAAGAVAWLAVVVSISGCAWQHASEAGLIAPPVRVGPLIKVLDVEKDLGGMRVVASADNSLHVLLDVPEEKLVLDMVVRQDGSVERRTIRRYDRGYPTMDAAFDEKGKLHAIIEKEHWALEADGWRISDPTPWSIAGVDVEKPGFVAGAPNLIWRFQVSGKTVGASRRLDWIPIGEQGMGGAVIPWLSRGTRAVFVSQSANGYGPWVVVEPHGDNDTDTQSAAADARGNVYAVYERSRPGVISMFKAQWRFARIPTEVIASGDAGATIRGRGESERVRYVAFDDSRAFTGCGVLCALAVDALSGTVVSAWSVIDADGTQKRAGPALVELVPGFEGNFAAGGGDTFHAVVVSAGGKPFGAAQVRYYFFSQGAWSSPIELDKIQFHFPMRAAMPAIVGMTDGGAVAVWRQQHAVVAQWIQRTR